MATKKKTDVQDEPETIKAVVAEEPSDIDRLDPQTNEVTLSTGRVVDLQPLKTRAFFRLLRIVTRGGATLLPSLNLSADMDEGEFVSNLMALVIFAIPEAEQETVEFMRSMVKPKGITGDREKDIPLYEELFEELDDPELEDTVIIVEAIIKREAKDLQALGKRLRSMFNLAQKTGQAPKAK